MKVIGNTLLLIMTELYIKQLASIKAPYQSTINAGWGNSNSIAIETCGYSLDKNENKRVGSKYDNIPHHHWEPVKDQQAKSVACLLKFLLNNFQLTIENVKVHEK